MTARVLTTCVAFLLAGSPAVAGTDAGWAYTVRVGEDGKPTMALAGLRNPSGETLWLTCARSVQPGANVRAAVSGPRYLGAGAMISRATVIRFDKATPSVDYWTYGERSGRLMDSASARVFVGRLAESSQVAIDLSNYRLETSTAVFRLDPAETKGVIGRLDGDCRRIAAAQS